MDNVIKELNEEKDRLVSKMNALYKTTPDDEQAYMNGQVEGICLALNLIRDNQTVKSGRKD